MTIASSWSRLWIVCALWAAAVALPSQTVLAAWHAQWIAPADGPARDYSVVYFRRQFEVSDVAKRFVVDVSADTRFELHVNGKRVNAGPALADVAHWRYETYDLGPYLVAGQNEIAAMVWNFGTSAPIAQMSSQTAFVLAAEDPKNAWIDTGKEWETSHERGRTLGRSERMGYYAAGPDEVMDGTQMVWDWDRPAAKGLWMAAKMLGNAAPRGAQDSPTRWILQKDELPSMLYEAVDVGRVVRVVGLAKGDVDLQRVVTIPAHADVTLLLDCGQLTTAYPELAIAGGLGGEVAMTYAEALYDERGQKGNRDEIAGRHIAGVEDRVVADGQRRTYRPLWWRCWRYLQVEVKTADEPLTIEHLGAFYTAYPFRKIASFDSDDATLGKIWDTGWRTAQLCAHETYMDTPYWEQMQYVGDTRIQALISYAVTGDDRLARQAMMAYRDSLTSDGLTQSRYPSSLTQIIPPFSLLWVGMLHDFWMYRDDDAFTRSLLPGTRGVIDWFAARQRADGLLGRVEWWPFVDWSPPLYDGGVPPQMADGGSSAITLQFIAALRDAAELEERLGEAERASRYRAMAARAADGLMRLSWVEDKGLLADTPAKASFSQQANSLAVMLDVIPKERQRAVMETVLASSKADSTVQMSQASYYFRFYVARAMVHAGLGDEYIAQLEPWRKMLALGLSTWAENPEPTRSDSHAWSAHPTYDLLTVVGGISPGSAGFGTVEIAPHLADLKRASATMPTPKGLVEVRYSRAGDLWRAVIMLPPSLTGQLLWKGKVTALHAGEQTIDLP
jgi:alpha-L-rhamnosidase